MLRASFATEAAEFLPDRKVETFEVPYGQLRQELLDSKSSLGRWRPDLAIFCDRLEDLIGQARLDGVSSRQIDAAVREYADLVASFHSANSGWAVVHRFARLAHSADATGGQATFSLVDEMNGLLAERLATLPQVLWLDVAAEAAAAPIAACDPMLWHLGRLPFSEGFSQRLAHRWIGLTLALLGKTARVVVLDLDNTLWGGVLGEEGLSGIRVGGDYPGNAYVTFQRALKTLPERGIGLAVCSRNDRDLAIQALETHSAMLIRPSDLIATRIDWRTKWEGLREIAAELNLGLESLLFVDDNPIEREQIRLNLPEVKILDLPASPAFFAEALADCPWLESAGLTAEDASRIGSYQTLQKVREERRTAASLDEFYAGLGMQLSLQPLDDSNIARAVQLSQKTNQFNATTRRYDQRALQTDRRRGRRRGGRRARRSPSAIRECRSDHPAGRSVRRSPGRCGLLFALLPRPGPRIGDGCAEMGRAACCSQGLDDLVGGRDRDSRGTPRCGAFSRTPALRPRPRRASGSSGLIPPQKFHPGSQFTIGCLLHDTARRFGLSPHRNRLRADRERDSALRTARLPAGGRDF